MKLIPTFVHGIIDYFTAFALLTGPRLLGWSPRLRRITGGMALATVLYSLLTRYELGLIKVIPMKGHLALDGVQAATTAMLPIMLGDEKPAARGALLGLAGFELLVTLSSQSEPRDANLLAPLTTDVYTFPSESPTPGQ